MIRLAGLGDVDALRTIAVAAYGKYVPRMGRAPAPMTADYAEAIRSRQARAAIEDGRIAGFAVLVAGPATCCWTTWLSYRPPRTAGSAPGCSAWLKNHGETITASTPGDPARAP